MAGTGSILAATAVVQFIGLVLFSNDFSPEDHMQALMPRISASAPRPGQLVAKGRTPITDSTPVSVIGTHIEDHAAVLVFRACDYVSSKGWAPMGLETVPGYLYVRMDGERVSMEPSPIVAEPVADATQRRTPVPSRFSERFEPAGLQLPHIKPCCKNEPKLRSEFLAPHYRGAAAVFDLKGGRLTACGASSKIASESRIDTRWELDNGGTLKIVGSLRNQKKELVVAGGAQVLAAHMPAWMLTQTQAPSTSTASDHHYRAYYDMIDQTQTCEPKFDCATATANVESCNRKGFVHGSSVWREGVPSPDVVPTGQPFDITQLLRVDFECSNSQWP